MIFYHDEYNKIIGGLNYIKVHLQLSKFEIEFKENLNDILSDLGMYEAFNPITADFTGLREEGNLYISQVIHKTYLKVFEDGYEGAEETSINIVISSIPIEEKYMI